MVVFQSVSKNFCYFVFLWDNNKKYFDKHKYIQLVTFAMFNNIFSKVWLKLQYGVCHNVVLSVEPKWFARRVKEYRNFSLFMHVGDFPCLGLA